jgi:hypothetical protein
VLYNLLSTNVVIIVPPQGTFLVSGLILYSHECDPYVWLERNILKKYNWWLYELDSLGISTLQKNGLGNQKEASDLTEAVKQTLYEEYLQAYSESNR